MSGAKEPTNISAKQQRIAMLARREPKFVMTSLAHHIDLDWLHEAHRRTRKDGAHGIDGQSAKDYAQNASARILRTYVLVIRDRQSSEAKATRSGLCLSTRQRQERFAYLLQSATSHRIQPSRGSSIIEVNA